MELSFYGAAHAVTGSCHYLKACGKHILIDCGLQQGQDSENLQDFPIPASQIDYVLLTHAHIDHSGRLPLLSKQGFHGRVFATDATSDLCDIMLRDSAHIQEFESEWRSRKGKRSGVAPKEPLYTMEDAEAVIRAFVPCIYESIITICNGIEIRFRDVGHLLGSACIEIWIEENKIKKKLVFSGDVGNINQPLIKDPSFVTEANYVVVESTYGDRLHNPPPDYSANLAAIIQKTFDRGGNVVIPAFAVGRTQELLYFIRHIKAENMVKGYGDFDVYVDSPLANEATEIFSKDRLHCFDEEAMALVKQGINPISFPGLHRSVTTEDSKGINLLEKPKVIISASGMCEAGRIKHHLKHNLWRKECSIVFVGYQAVGTTGRALADGAKHIKLFGEDIEVNAEIVKLEGISGHADQKQLLKWLDAFQPAPEQVYIVHGENQVCDIFAEIVRNRYHIPVASPLYSASYDLLSGKMLHAGIEQEQEKRTSREPDNTAYTKLLSARSRLEEVISHNKGGTNRDLEKFYDQIIALCNTWER